MLIFLLIVGFIVAAVFISKFFQSIFSIDGLVGNPLVSFGIMFLLFSVGMFFLVRNLDSFLLPAELYEYNGTIVTVGHYLSGFTFILGVLALWFGIKFAIDDFKDQRLREEKRAAKGK